MRVRLARHGALHVSLPWRCCLGANHARCRLTHVTTTVGRTARFCPIFSLICCPFARAQAKGAEKAAMGVQSKMNLQTAPIRTYLDSTVVPVLLQGLSALVKERPPNPTEYLATYLLQNQPEKPQ